MLNVINRFPIVSYILISYFFILVDSVSADVIVLENGDRLIGTVTKMEEDILTFTTSYSEPIKIKRAAIKSVHTDDLVEVHLIGGEIIKGRLETSGDGLLLVESSIGRKPVIIDWGKVSYLNPTPPTSPKWEGSVTIGAGLQSGNTDRVNTSVGAETTRKIVKDRLSLRFLFNYAEESSKITARNTYGALKYDYFFTKYFYGFLSIELLNDKFKDLSLRTVVGPGVGYQFWDDPIKFLLFEGGVSYFSEDLNKGVDKQWVAARLASILRYKIIKNVSFDDHFVIYPNLEEFGRYQLRNEASISSLLGFGWSLNFKNILEHNSHPPIGVKKSDLDWILGLKYSF